MSIDFIIRTKLDNKGIVQAESELRKLFDEGAKLYSSGGIQQTPLSGIIDSTRIEEGNRALQESIQLIRQAREEAKTAARGSAAQGDLSQAAGLERVVQGYDQQLALLNRLKPAQQQFAGLQDVINRNAEKFRGAESLKDYQKALQSVSASLKEQAASQLKSGNILAFEDTQKARNQVESFTNSLKNLQGEEERTGNITSIMNSKFNQFGFTLFITISTIRQVIQIAKQMFDTFLEGAQVADRVQSFAFALENAGLSASEMRADLKEASQGIVDIDTAMKGTIQLLKSGLPDAANKSDELLKIATNAAIVSGEVENADVIYQKLIRGIVRASPRLIDDADILLKLGDAYGEYAASIGKTSDQLTVVEQKMATLNAVLREGERIEVLASGFESTAQPLKSLETSLKEAADNLKLFFGVLASGVAQDVGGASAQLRDGLIQSLLDAGLVSEEASSKMQLAFGSFGNFLATLLSALSASVGAFVEVVMNGARGIGTALGAAVDMIQALGQLAIGNIDAAQATDLVNQAYQRAAGASEEFRNSLFTGGHATERFADWMDRFGISVRNSSENVQEMTQDLNELRKAQEQAQLGSQLSDIEKQLEKAIEARTGIEAQRSEKLLDAREDLSDKLAEIEDSLGDRLSDIKETYNKKLIKMGQDYRDKVTKIAKDTADELADIDNELSNDLNENTTKSSKDRAEASKTRNKALEDIAEDHQKKLAEIERKYQLDRMKALIDRDARALFEAEQNRKSDIDEALSDAEQKRKDEEEQYKERIKEINELEEEHRQELIKNAEQRRRDALKSQAEQLADLKESYIKQKIEAKKSYQEQRRDAIQAAREQRDDAQKAYREKLQDISKWYKDQLALQRERQLREKIAELKHLQEMGELTKDHLNELKRMYSEYNSFVESGGNSGGNINYTPGTGTGIPGGGSSGGQPPLPTIPGQIDTSFGGTRGSSGGFSTQSVKINVTNDKTLEQIFKEMSYEAVVEVVG